MAATPVAITRKGSGLYCISFVVAGSPKQHIGVAGSFASLCATLSPEIVLRWTSGKDRLADGTRQTTIEFKDLLPDASGPPCYLNIKESVVSTDGDVLTVMSFAVPLADHPGTPVHLEAGTLRLSPAASGGTTVAYNFEIGRDGSREHRRVALMILRRMMMRVKEFMEKHTGG